MSVHCEQEGAHGTQLVKVIGNQKLVSGVSKNGNLKTK
jgi:hypothetical protein